ncbi:hypothetical protein PJK55_14525 [Exiguobacterium sp. MMG028]|uniref:phage tail assembly chaperone n=1 Tax=Exiguobacterium sp. MMG028 TaxID=3021979 RepID=UPI0022FE7E08|nr:hypothetical protein [Exiguobacterium sp. MMG028]MDA5561951.1 hypothetical protein [Exiguobacterium sp. MMG028]
MAKLSVRERLLKRKEDVLKVPVRLDADTTVYVHELKPEVIDSIRHRCKKDDKVDTERMNALMILEAVHEADGTKSLDAALKQELDILDDISFVDMAYRVGEKERIEKAMAEAMGFVDPKEAEQEAAELKN